MPPKLRSATKREREEENEEEKKAAAPSGESALVPTQFIAVTKRRTKTKRAKRKELVVHTLPEPGTLYGGGVVMEENGFRYLSMVPGAKDGIEKPQPTPVHAAVREAGDAKALAGALAALGDDEAKAREAANETDAEGHCPLHYAVKADRADLVGLLLGAGADPDGVNEAAMDTRSPIHVAAQQGSVRVAEMLLDAGADPAVVEFNSSMSAVGLATVRLGPDRKPAEPAYDLAMIDLLLERGGGGEPRKRDGGDLPAGYALANALAAAAAGDCLPAVERLLQAGADAGGTWMDPFGQTVANCAAGGGAGESLLAVLRRLPEERLADQVGSALRTAIQGGYCTNGGLRSVVALLDAFPEHATATGALPGGLQPLTAAVMRGAVPEVALELLRRGADPADGSRDAVLRCVLERNAQLTAKDKKLVANPPPAADDREALRKNRRLVLAQRLFSSSTKNGAFEAVQAWVREH